MSFQERRRELSPLGKRMWDGIKARIELEDQSRSTQKLVNAYRYMAASRFPELTEEMVADVDGSYDLPDDPSFEQEEEIFTPEDCVFINIYWRDRALEGTHWVKGFSVKAFHNGAIFIDAGLFGSSILYEKDWKGNTVIRKEKLKKAYDFPKIMGSINPESSFQGGLGELIT